LFRGLYFGPISDLRHLSENYIFTCLTKLEKPGVRRKYQQNIKRQVGKTLQKKEEKENIKEKLNLKR
jgi:hypothetical protein